jgi:hypothetical protein
MPKLMISNGDPTVFLVDYPGSHLYPLGGRSPPFVTEPWVDEPVILPVWGKPWFKFLPSFIAINVYPVRAVDVLRIESCLSKHFPVSMGQIDVGIEMKKPILFRKMA